MDTIHKGAARGVTGYSNRSNAMAYEVTFEEFIREALSGVTAPLLEGMGTAPRSQQIFRLLVLDCRPVPIGL
jgi:hypothetical protein